MLQKQIELSSAEDLVAKSALRSASISTPKIRAERIELASSLRISGSLASGQHAKSTTNRPIAKQEKPGKRVPNRVVWISNSRIKSNRTQISLPPVSARRTDATNVVALHKLTPLYKRASRRAA